MENKNKVILILADGMRPDALMQCGNGYTDRLLAESSYTLSASTVMPSVTLPCHMSLFHGVTPERHGILSNTYVPQVRPIRGLFEVLRSAGKKNMMFYNWEELRDVSRPDSLAYSEFVSGHSYGFEEANEKLTDDAISVISAEQPDFVFLYLGWADEAGHACGWMSEEYLRAVSLSVGCVRRVIENIPDGYTVIFTADHGGHGRTHGFDVPEDMTIPLIIHGKDRRGEQLGEANITDVPSTVAALLGVCPDPEWEGKNLL